MALVYETGTPTDPQDLVNKLQIFAAANGWIVDDYDNVNNECTIHESSMYVHFAWDNSGTEINICQSLGYTGGLAIDVMPNDSGNGSATVGSQRRAEFDTAGSYTAYHFFAQDTAPKHIHIVVEVSAAVYRHFGFGTIIKANDWTGGEYAYGMKWDQNANNIDTPTTTPHTVGLDGSCFPTTGEEATMHIEGISWAGGGGGAQGVNEKWGVFKNTTSGSAGLDTAGETRRVLYGGWRGGLYTYSGRHFKYAGLNAYVPIIPIPVFWRDSTPTPDIWMYLGQQPNIGIINMNFLSPADEFTLGGETWMVFPFVRKQFLQTNTEESWNAGVAYRKS